MNPREEQVTTEAKPQEVDVMVDRKILEGRSRGT